MIIGKNSTDPFTNWLLTAAQKTIDADYPNVSYITTSLENDPSQIVTLLDQAALDDYDGVLIQKGSNSHNSDAWYQSATEEGLKITAINAYANDGVSSASYADDAGMARTIAEYMAEKLPGKRTGCFSSRVPTATKQLWIVSLLSALTSLTLVLMSRFLPRTSSKAGPRKTHLR